MPSNCSLPKHIEHLPAERFASILQFIKKRAIDIAFTGFFGDQIPEVANLRLPDAVNATESLFDTVRIPRQVVVHHQVRALQIDAFARRIGSDEHLHFRIVLNASCAFERSSRPMPP